MILYPVDWSAHSLGVANYMREHAEERGLNPDDMWLLGLLHDIGNIYDNDGHAEFGATMLAHAGFKPSLLNAVRHHMLPGNKVRELYGESALTAEYNLLVEADGHVDSKGRRVTLEERLEDVRSRYGENHKVYKTSLEGYKYLKSIE